MLYPVPMEIIEGVRLIDLEVFADGRGAFTESYRREWFEGGRDIVQVNLSRSNMGVLRGMHFHRRQADYWCIVLGRAFVALHDLRLASPTTGVTMTLTLDEGTPQGLFIPPGVAHGFYAETDVVLQYMVDEYFDGSDEYGIAWDDTSLGIDWPGIEPVLSDRDRSNPPLTEVVRPP